MISQRNLRRKTVECTNILWTLFSLLTERFSLCPPFSLFDSRVSLNWWNSILVVSFPLPCDLLETIIWEFWPMRCQGEYATAFWENTFHTLEGDTQDLFSAFVCPYFWIWWLELLQDLGTILWMKSAQRGGQSQDNERKFKHHACCHAVFGFALVSSRNNWLLFTTI